MNKVDVHNWIIKVINSCETFSQWAKCIKLIQRHRIMFEDAKLEYVQRRKHDIKLKLLK